MKTMVLAGVLASTQVASMAVADPFDLPTYVPSQPHDDRAALADLAPPSNAATARMTYGDAAFAPRSRVIYDGARQAVRGDIAVGHTRCPARTPRATFFECRRATSAFFRRTYVYTPSYVSAPQVVDQPARRASPLLPAITEFAINPFR